MFDFRSHYAIVKSVMVDKAKEEHKPSLGNKANMAAYAKATGNTGKAKFLGMDDELATFVDYPEFAKNDDDLRIVPLFDLSDLNCS